ncbi:MAG: hypothetical protein JWM16_627 [Verrucomicrobiales bacterium]|nr:hypothetical protein [Verrucomicrobiales bacterium]
MDGSTNWHLVLCSLIAVVALSHAFCVYHKKQPIAVVDLACWVTSAYFGLGPWVAFVYGKGRLPQEDFDILTFTYLSIGLFLVGLYCAKIFSPKKLDNEGQRQTGLFHLLQNTPSVSFTALLVFCGLVWAVRVLLAFQFGIGLSGTVTEEALSNMPYAVFIIYSIFDSVAFACAFCAAGFLFHAPKKKWQALFIVLLELIWAYGQGRRWVLGLLVVVTLAFLSTGRRPKLSHLICSGALVGFLVLWAFPAFLAFRTQYLSSSSNREALSSIFEVGKDIATAEMAETSDMYRENMAERPLIVGFNFRILEAQNNCELMWGHAFANTFIWIIPSVFYPAKASVLLQSEENIQHHYGLPLVDTSSNWPAYATADFGWCGPLFVGFLLGVLISLLEGFAWSQAKLYPLLGFCTLGVAVNIAITVEETPLFAWENIRNLILLSIFLKITIPLFRSVRVFDGLWGKPNPGLPSKQFSA